MRYLFSAPLIYIYSFFIFFISLIPSPVSVEVTFFDKVVHFLIYSSLSFLVVNHSFKIRRGSPYIFSFFYAFLLGLIIEFIQLPIPYRQFDLGDIFSNFLGSLLGCRLKILN